MLRPTNVEELTRRVVPGTVLEGLKHGDLSKLVVSLPAKCQAWDSCQPEIIYFSWSLLQELEGTFLVPKRAVRRLMAPAS
jgi:hypothetical protein